MMESKKSRLLPQVSLSAGSPDDHDDHDDHDDDEDDAVDHDDHDVSKNVP